MKLAKIIDPRFTNSFKKLTAEALPLKTAFKLKDTAKKIEEAFTKYEELRKVAINKYGKKDDKDTLVMDENGNVEFADDQMELFIKELQELVNVEVEVAKIKIDDLGDGLKLSAEELMFLEDLFDT